jgi:TPR repeat protein
MDLATHPKERPASKPKSTGQWIVAALLSVLLFAAALWWGEKRHSRSSKKSLAAKLGTPAGQVASPSEVADAHAPNPARMATLMAAFDAANELENKGDWPKAIDAWLRVAKDYPDSPVGRNHLETMLNHLRDRPSPITLEEFQGIRAQIFECAQRDILAAMLLIGDTLRNQEPEIAAHWFSIAAAKGDSTGLVQYGWMLLKGEGLPADPSKAFGLFQQAADRGDISGKYHLAICYLNGYGVGVDAKRGVVFAREAADAGDTRAMVLLGVCYDHASGVPKDSAVAVRYFSQAAEGGNLEALGNLGVHYVNGEGVPVDAKRAVGLFEKGAKAGNPFCMWLYASSLHAGRGVTKNELLATVYFKKSAALGNRLAKDWCNKQSIPYGAEN